MAIWGNLPPWGTTSILWTKELSGWSTCYRAWVKDTDGVWKLVYGPDPVGGPFIDSSIYDHPVTAGATADINKTNYKFGAAALECVDATSYCEVDVGDLRIAQYQDFCIDFWVYSTNVANMKYIFELGDSTTDGIMYGFCEDTLTADLFINGFNYSFGPHNLPSGAWQHIAITRNWGGDRYYLKVWWNGARQYEFDSVGFPSITDAIAWGTSQPLRVGADQRFSGAAFMRGQLDEFRVAVGDSSFQTTGPYTNPDANTKVLLHFDSFAR